MKAPKVYRPWKLALCLAAGLGGLAARADEPKRPAEDMPPPLRCITAEEHAAQEAAMERAEAARASEVGETPTTPTESTAPADSVAPAAAPAKKERYEVAFLLDTTGSMSGLIEAAKQKIWAIANELATSETTGEIRFAVVAYRDRGDDYVTQVFDLTDDIDKVHAFLMGLSAGGGGDGPEHVNQALKDGLEKLSWSSDEDAFRMMFLVGDAPPHMDYGEAFSFRTLVPEALKKGINVHAIQCGNWDETTRIWQEVAKLGDGSFKQIEQDGGVAAATAIATPLDGELARLRVELAEAGVLAGAPSPSAPRGRVLRGGEDDGDGAGGGLALGAPAAASAPEIDLAKLDPETRVKVEKLRALEAERTALVAKSLAESARTGGISADERAFDRAVIDAVKETAAKRRAEGDGK